MNVFKSNGLLMLLVWAFGFPANATEMSHNGLKTPTEHIIEIKNFSYSPANLEINQGDTVTWINEDVVQHNVAQAIDENWVSPKLKKGETFSLVLNADLAYVCSLHRAVMNGQITVLQNKSP